MFWINRGYFEHGGLWVRKSSDPADYRVPSDNEDVKWIYQSSPMGHLQVAHLLERIHYALTGEYNYRLMRLHNQVLVLLSSALLGLLAMRLALKMPIRSFHALLLGIAAQVTYQTFPANLWYYWELYCTAVTPIFVILFLLLAERILFQRQVTAGILILRALCVFGMVYTDYTASLFFLSTYILCCAVLGFPVFKNQHVFKTIILPSAVALGLFTMQLAWVRIHLPGLGFVGSNYTFRTGFDGSIKYYKDHFDLLYGFRRARFGFLNWRCLFAAGSASILLLAAIRHKFRYLNYPVFVLVAALGLYVPYAFMFSQAAALHPYMYDVYLLIPLLLSVFSVLPATFEKLTGNKGTFILLFIALAFCYAMVQIRAYAIQFPIAH